MDIKLKNNNSKYIISTVIFLLLIVLSAGFYSAYPIIKDKAKEYEENIFEKEDFLVNLNQSNYGIYFDMLKNKENKTLKPSEIFINEDTRYYEQTQQEIANEKRLFDERIYSYKQSLDSNLKNLDYYAINKEKTVVKERTKSGIDALLADNNDNSSIEALNNKYSFYLVIDYNENGELNIKRVYGADKLVVIDKLKNNNRSTVFDTEIKPIKNITYVYAVAKELQYEDLISGYKTRSKIHSYNMALSNFTSLALFLMIIVGLVVPFKISKELVGFKKVTKLPIEISAFILIFIICGVLNEASYSMISGTLEKELIDFSPLVLNEATTKVLEIIINIMFWTICFGIVFISIILFKYIFSIGVKKFLKENSLVYKVLRSIWRTIKRTYDFLISFDLKNNENKRIVKLLGINLIIVSVISLFWFFGVFVAIVYTIVLMKLIKKNYDNISSKYNKLFEITNKIAEGNLDVNIEDDLGIFNAFKSELQNIQKGFKKAVNEEVKSQKMKTELITNVSHDLKTPLTSIITYIDLLKDENISSEKRVEYLDVLDRKSQRLKELIEDLFEVSKATSGNISLNIVEVDVVSLMKQTLLELDDKILKSSLKIRTNYPEEKVVLPLDSQRMFRVFENLIINITKYAMEGSRVYIDITNNMDKVEIVLRNIAANEINFSVDEIMERFVRGDKSRNTEGSGLGLAIAKSFVDLQGGKLEVIVDGDLFKIIITFDKN